MQLGMVGLGRMGAKMVRRLIKAAINVSCMKVDRAPGPKEMEAYERMLTGAMAGDATLFACEDYVEEAWRIVEPVLGNITPVHEYAPKNLGAW